MLFSQRLVSDKQMKQSKENSNFMAPKPEGSSPCSQEPATGPYSEQTESTPLPPADLPKIHFDPIHT
jgi:hypothetical protein